MCLFNILYGEMPVQSSLIFSRELPVFISVFGSLYIMKKSPLLDLKITKKVFSLLCSLPFHSPNGVIL